MNEAVKTPWHLWAVGIISLLWNAFGAFDYVMTKLKNPEYMAAFTPEQQAYFYSFPLWANLGWALGVWGSVLGSILLLARRRQWVCCAEDTHLGAYPRPSVIHHPGLRRDDGEETILLVA